MKAKKLILPFLALVLIVALSIGITAVAAVDTTAMIGKAFATVSTSNIVSGAGTIADPYVLSYGTMASDGSIGVVRNISASYTTSTGVICPVSGATLTAYPNSNFTGTPLTTYDMRYNRYAAVYCKVVNGSVTQYFKVYVGARNAALSIKGTDVVWEQSYETATNPVGDPKLGQLLVAPGSSTTITASDIKTLPLGNGVVTLTSGSGGSQTVTPDSVITFSVLANNLTCYYSVSAVTDLGGPNPDAYITKAWVADPAAGLTNGGTIAAPTEVNYTLINDSAILSDARVCSNYIQGSVGATVSYFSDPSFTTTVGTLDWQTNKYVSVYTKVVSQDTLTTNYFKVTLGSCTAVKSIDGRSIVYSAWQNPGSNSLASPKTGTIMVIQGENYTFDATDAGKLDPGATVTLIDASGNTLESTTVTKGDTVYLKVDNTGESATSNTAYYAITLDAYSTDAGISKIIGSTTGWYYSSNAGTLADKIFIAKGNLADRVKTLTADIIPATNATIKYYSDANCTSEIPGTTSYTIDGSAPSYTVYAKVTAQDGTTVKYYKVEFSVATISTKRFTMSSASDFTSVKPGQTFEVNVLMADSDYAAGSAIVGWESAFTYNASYFDLVSCETFAPEGQSVTVDTSNGFLRFGYAGTAYTNAASTVLATLTFTAKDVAAVQASNAFFAQSIDVHTADGAQLAPKYLSSKKIDVIPADFNILGAQWRTSGTPGMRFGSTLSKTDAIYTQLLGAGATYDYATNSATIKFGTIIAFAADDNTAGFTAAQGLNGRELTLDADPTTTMINCVAEVFGQDDTTIMFTGVLTGFGSSTTYHVDSSTQFVARPYVQYTVAGVTYTVYGTEITRSWSNFVA